MNTALIVNPAAGVGRCADKCRFAVDLMKEQGMQVTQSVSDYPGHVPLLVEKAIDEGARRVIIAGGDGTFREALAPLINSGVQVFLFPFGTGNDFARFIGISEDPGEAIQQLIKGSARKLDVGKANSYYFVNVAGLGFDVDVLLQKERFVQKVKDKIAYKMAIVSALVGIKSHTVRVGGEKGFDTYNSMVLSVGNGRFIGGGIAALPQADAFDGLFDVCIMHDVKKRRLISTLMKFVKGEHLGLNETKYYKTSSVTVHTKKPLPVQLDGEIIERTPVTFTLLPGAIEMIL